MQPSVTAFSSLPVSYLHTMLQCYCDFMCQAGNTDTANSKPDQKCQIHPPISFMAFLTLIRILSTRLLFCKRDPRSKSEVLDSVCKIKKRLAGRWWLHNTVNIVSATGLGLERVKAISDTSLATLEIYMIEQNQSFYLHHCLQRLANDKTAYVMSMSRRLFIKLLP